MATYTLNPGDIGTYARVLVGGVVDTVIFPGVVTDVEIYTSGGSTIYVSLDGTDPTTGGGKTLMIPSQQGKRTLRIPNRNDATVVKLISTGTPTYSVALPWPPNPINS